MNQKPPVVSPGSTDIFSDSPIPGGIAAPNLPLSMKPTFGCNDHPHFSSFNTPGGQGRIDAAERSGITVHRMDP